MFTYLSIVGFISGLAVLALLIWLYLRTRNAGYILLALAVPLWPYVWGLPIRLLFNFDDLMSGDAGLLPGLSEALGSRLAVGEIAALITHMGRIFQSVLLIFALLLLAKGVAKRTSTTAN